MPTKEPLLSDIPIVSAEHLESNNLRLRAAAQVLFEYGLRDIGFVFLRPNWKNQDLLFQAYRQYEDFFHTVFYGHKTPLHRPDLHHQRGWTPPLTEKALGAKVADLKECLFFGPELPKNHPLKKKYPIEYHDNLWPDKKMFPLFKETTLELYQQLAAFADVVVATLEQILHVPRFSWQPDLVKDAPSVMRALYYPPTSNLRDIRGELVAGGGHKDLNFITILPWATKPGLWAKRRDGLVVEVNCPKDCVVVQCGNGLEYLTGGELMSAEHGVKFYIGREPRFSIAYFVHVLLDTVLKPLPQFSSAETVKKYPPIRAIDFLNKRLKEIKLKK